MDFSSGDMRVAGAALRHCSENSPATTLRALEQHSAPDPVESEPRPSLTEVGRTNLLKNLLSDPEELKFEDEPPEEGWYLWSDGNGGGHYFLQVFNVNGELQLWDGEGYTEPVGEFLGPLLPLADE